MSDVGMVRRVLWRGMVGIGVAACSLVASSSAVANAPNPAIDPAPGISVVKLQREGSSGPFTPSAIYALVGTAIDYEIQVTNTGSTPLSLTVTDPLCGPGTLSGPVQLIPTLNGDLLEPGGEAQYTCSHLLTGSDASPFINTVTVIGQPPAGASVLATSSVRANKQAVGAITITRCARRKVKRGERGEKSRRGERMRRSERIRRGGKMRRSERIRRAEKRHARRATGCVATRRVHKRRRIRRVAFTG